MSFCSVLAFIYSSLAVAVVGPTVRVLPVVYTPVIEGADASADAILNDGVIGEATFLDVELTLSLVSRRRIGSCWLPSPDKFDEAYIFLILLTPLVPKTLWATLLSSIY